MADTPDHIDDQPADVSAVIWPLAYVAGQTITAREGWGAGVGGA